jgi:hypothetical protein
MEELDSSRAPLQEGEKWVLEFFDSHLNLDWEIYIQPHLNGLRPDFVLLNPNVGIAVFEVKDWNLEAMDYFQDRGLTGRPEMFGRKDGQRFKLENQNPVTRIWNYRNEIMNLYCPRLEKRNGIAAVTAGIIMPFADENRARHLLKPFIAHRGMDKYPRYSPIVGRQSLKSPQLLNVFPEANRLTSKLMNPVLAQDLRNWLVDPEFAVEQRSDLQLDPRQEQLAMNRTPSGYRRIRGPAGSGKSLVLAARAAELVAAGKDVLVVTYNITLRQYLQDLTVRRKQVGGSIRRSITWLNFHLWCKRVCLDAGRIDDYSEFWRKHFDTDPDNQSHLDLSHESLDNILDSDLINLVNRVITEDTAGVVTRYDAILVDEAQDFMPEWWNALRRVCKDGGEMLLVADATQDVYGIASSWTDAAMRGAGFYGPWSDLKACYRMPETAIPHVRKFAETFLPENSRDLPQVPQGSLELHPCQLRWVQTSEDRAITTCEQEMLRLFEAADPDILAVSDLTLLVATRDSGSEIVDKIRSNGIKVIHTFDQDKQEERRRKLAFYMGDARVKATTLHSFKGWESTAILLFIDDVRSDKDYALVYSGLTRLKRSTSGSYLTVVCCAEALSSYGESWPSFEQH